MNAGTRNTCVNSLSVYAITVSGQSGSSANWTVLPSEFVRVLIFLHPSLGKAMDESTGRTAIFGIFTSRLGLAFQSVFVFKIKPTISLPRRYCQHIEQEVTREASLPVEPQYLSKDQDQHHSHKHP